MKVKTMRAVATLVVWALTTLTTVAQTATIEQVWIDYNTNWNNQKGMTIHTKLTIRGAKDQNLHATAIHYFEHANGVPLWGNSQDFYSIDPSGNPQATAFVGFDITPQWEHTIFNDWWIFVPYSAFHLASGKHALRVVTLIKDDTAGRFIQDNSYTSYFDYDAGTPVPAPQQSGQWEGPSLSNTSINGVPATLMQGTYSNTTPTRSNSNVNSAKIQQQIQIVNNAEARWRANPSDHNARANYEAARRALDAMMGR